MRTSKKNNPSESLAYEQRRSQEHPHCIACGAKQSNGQLNDFGLGLQFELVDNARVEATFDCHQKFEGYPNVLHGGIVCMLLDAAMTNCLFANHVAAVTGDMKVRFRKPITIEEKVTIRAWIESPQPPLFKVAAELLQNDRVKASAHARFVDRKVAASLVSEHAKDPS